MGDGEAKKQRLKAEDRIGHGRGLLDLPIIRLKAILFPQPPQAPIVEILFLEANEKQNIYCLVD